SNVSDNTRFFTKSGSGNDVKWVPFSDLWLTWSATFSKGFGIADAKVAKAVDEDKLLKLNKERDGTVKVARGTGTGTDITSGADYNLTASRAATDRDR